MNCHLIEQIENYNEPFLDAMREYDDGKDLSEYDFSKDGFGPPIDDPNKRKLAYRHRVIAQKYTQVVFFVWSFVFLCHASCLSFWFF